MVLIKQRIEVPIIITKSLKNENSVAQMANKKGFLYIDLVQMTLKVIKQKCQRKNN